ncbi:hypothetical protein LLS47_21335 [Rouxiella badensis]|uniref:Uncharacterized protein n=1 Tax=Rouxiella silvae TaxID=1646373 RepID=A0AA40X386_9GAMM|nr:MULTISPECIES: hypothetical protein [Rouxiella]KAB7896419.1 hypothetical protein GA565_10735 [Rouxiella sp. S1S-2]MBF6637881.1 hypothetical protein [Rouxiella silvae]MCC3705202.1 hypothetical protein [Rouxiella badensis]MCC3735477.1 hypothetical protein [Rouxiella badensis]MCC3760774.1 hypothetical protein [Rouxiella badensis]
MNKTISFCAASEITISLSNVESAVAILNLALVPDIEMEDRLVIEGVIKLLNPVIDNLTGVIEELK